MQADSLSVAGATLRTTDAIQKLDVWGLWAYRDITWACIPGKLAL